MAERTYLSPFDWAALKYFGREKATNERSAITLRGVPLSTRTAVLLFARIDLLMGLVDVRS